MILKTLGGSWIGFLDCDIRFCLVAAIQTLKPQNAVG